MSEGAKIWQNFRQDRLALGSLIFIGLLLFVITGIVNSIGKLIIRKMN